MNKFVEYSMIERQHIENLTDRPDNYLLLRKTTDPTQYECYDCTIQSGITNTILVTEIKVRNFDSDRFDTSIFPVPKLREIQKKVKEFREVGEKHGFRILPYYIAFFNDNVALGWVIPDEIEEYLLDCPVSQVNSKMVPKTVTYFEHQNANRYYYEKREINDLKDDLTKITTLPSHNEIKLKIYNNE